MKFDFTVRPKIFKALLNVDVPTLNASSHKDLRPILPCLVRMGLITPSDTTAICSKNRYDILTFLSDIESINSIVTLLAVDFKALEDFVKEELKSRDKVGDFPCDYDGDTLALHFERSDSKNRLNLVLSELLQILFQAQLRERERDPVKYPEFYKRHYGLFDQAAFIPEICDAIVIAIAELPNCLVIQEIAHSLLHVKYGPEIICRIVANFPDAFYDVCMHLIEHNDKYDDDVGGSKIRMDTLTALCRMFPQAAYIIRLKCVELGKMPALTITLTLDFPEYFSDELGSGYPTSGGDIIPFTLGLLLGNDQGVRTWFSIYARTRQRKNTALQRLRDELVIQLKSVVKIAQEGGETMGALSVVRGSIILRLYCALKVIAGIKINDDEIKLILKLITCHPPPTVDGVRFASISVCLLFACPALVGHQDYEIQVIQWLRWLSGSESLFFGKPTDLTSSFSEMLLLLAIHVHGGQYNAITDLVSSTLGMKMSIRNHNITRIRSIFIQDVFTEQLVAARSVSMLVTPNLNANIRGFLPIHCIHQLMKSKAFSKYKINVKDWIYKQICVSVAPLHPLLPPLIDVYVNSMLHVPTNRSSYELIINERIEEAEIMEVFKDSLICNMSSTASVQRSYVPQLLILYYILLYEDIRQLNLHHYIVMNREVKSYSPEFLSSFPIKYLLQQAQKDQHNYSILFSSLLRLLATHFPHLSLVEDWLDDDSVSLIYSSSVVVTDLSLSDAMQSMSSCPAQASRQLNALLTMPSKQLWSFANTFVKHLRTVLDPAVPLYLQELCGKVWLRFNSILPRTLWASTIKALLHKNSVLPCVPPKQEKVIIDPLQILRCDERVFRCVPILRIVIRVVQSSLAASRSQLNRHLADGLLAVTSAPGINSHMKESQDKMRKFERESLKNALIASQESAAIQILLEICRKTHGGDKNSKENMWALKEVQSLICSHLHQVFIADMDLCKLVHTQGYPLELLPITVTGIPSLHICLNEVEHLLKQSDIEKQVFTVNLASHLSLQYSLPQSMNIARLTMNTLNSLLHALPSIKRNELLFRTLKALVRICEAFPPLIEDTIGILLQYGKIVSSELTIAENAVVLDIVNKVEDHLSHTVDSNVHVFNKKLYKKIEETFEAIITKAVLKRHIY